jgi:hypothetical protein
MLIKFISFSLLSISYLFLKKDFMLNPGDEMVDMSDLGSDAVGCVGSSPILGIENLVSYRKKHCLSYSISYTIIYVV